MALGVGGSKFRHQFRWWMVADEMPYQLVSEMAGRRRMMREISQRPPPLLYPRFTIGDAHHGMVAGFMVVGVEGKSAKRTRTLLVAIDAPAGDDAGKCCNICLLYTSDAADE